MTDEAYTLMQTNRERAIMKRSAANRVSGAKTHYAGSFGVEGKSTKQLASMNGPVMSMDPRKFYTWKEFKALSPNLQIEYLEKMVYRYNIGLEAIAKEQFGLNNSSALMKHMTRHIDPNYKSPNKSGFKSSKAGREKYLNDMAEAWCTSPVEEHVSDMPETTATKTETPAKETNAMDTLTNPVLETFAEPETPAADIHMNIHMNGLDMNLLSHLAEMLRNYPNIPVNIVIGTEMNNIIEGESSNS